jgi:hypothetical protein
MAMALPIHLRGGERQWLGRKRQSHPDRRVRHRAGIVLMSEDV